MRVPDLSEEQALDVTPLWWLFIVVGIISLIAGCILVAEPSHSLATLAVIFGIFLLVDGIAELIMSFGHRVDNRGLAALLGVLGIVIGIILIRHPTHAVSAIGLIIGIWLVAAGVVRFVRALVASAHPVLGVAIALLEVVVGIVIVSDPHIGYTALAILLGIWLIINGIVTVGLGIAVRSARSELESGAQAATSG